MTDYFDSHCHLHDPAFDDDRDAVLRRARAAGVREIVVIGSDPADAERARALAAPAGGADVPRVWHTAGLHPHEARRWGPEVEAVVRDHLALGAVAVGETGLDYHYDNSPRDAQRQAFAAQLAIAAGAGAPVVIHSREAEEDTLAVLADSDVPPERVVLHCFSSSPSMLEAGVDRGYRVSFSGMVTFGKFPAEDLVPRVPTDRLLAETDAPYLAPAPHRGKRNEPAYVVETVARLAELRREPVEAMASTTRSNTLWFYGLDDVT